MTCGHSAGPTSCTSVLLESGIPSTCLSIQQSLSVRRADRTALQAPGSHRGVEESKTRPSRNGVVHVGETAPSSPSARDQITGHWKAVRANTGVLGTSLGEQGAGLAQSCGTGGSPAEERVTQLLIRLSLVPGRHRVSNCNFIVSLVVSQCCGKGLDTKTRQRMFLPNMCT